MQDTIQYGSLCLTRYFSGYRSFHLHLGVACCGGLNTPGKHRWAVILDSWLLRCQKRQRWRQKQEDLEDYHLKSYFCFISLLPSFLPAAVWTKASLRGSIKLIWIFHKMTSCLEGRFIPLNLAAVLVLSLTNMWEHLLKLSFIMFPLYWVLAVLILHGLVEMHSKHGANEFLLFFHSSCTDGFSL